MRCGALRAGVDTLSGFFFSLGMGCIDDALRIAVCCRRIDIRLMAEVSSRCLTDVWMLLLVESERERGFGCDLSIPLPDTGLVAVSHHVGGQDGLWKRQLDMENFLM